MSIRTLTKVSGPTHPRDKTPHKFRDWFTGELFTYVSRDRSLPCRTRVGADIIAVISQGGWRQH